MTQNSPRTKGTEVPTVGVSGLVRANSGIGVIQKNVYPLLAERSTLIESPSRDSGKTAILGLLRGMLPGSLRVDGYLGIVSPLPLMCPRPLVYIVHDLRWTTDKNAAKRLYRKIDLWRAVRRADLLICVSDQTRNALTKMFPRALPKSRTAWLGPGVMHEPVWNRSKKGNVLLIGGAARKRNELALAVIESLPPGIVTSITTIGTSPEVTERATQIMPNRTRHLDYATDAEMIGCFATAQYYVHLGTNEGFGLPFVEALRSDTVVVAVDQPLTREVLADSAILLPNTSDPAILATAWSSAALPTFSQRKSRAELFSWTILAEAINDGLGLRSNV